MTTVAPRRPLSGSGPRDLRALGREGDGPSATGPRGSLRRPSAPMLSQGRGARRDEGPTLQVRQGHGSPGKGLNRVAVVGMLIPPGRVGAGQRLGRPGAPGGRTARARGAQGSGPHYEDSLTGRRWRPRPGGGQSSPGKWLAAGGGAVTVVPGNPRCTETGITAAEDAEEKRPKPFSGSVTHHKNGEALEAPSWTTWPGGFVREGSGFGMQLSQARKSSLGRGLSRREAGRLDTRGGGVFWDGPSPGVSGEKPGGPHHLGRNSRRKKFRRRPLKATSYGWRNQDPPKIAVDLRLRSPVDCPARVGRYSSGLPAMGDPPPRDLKEGRLLPSFAPRQN